MVEFTTKYNINLSEITTALFLTGYGYTSFVYIPLFIFYNNMSMLILCLRILFESQVVAMQLLIYNCLEFVTESLFFLICWIERNLLVCAKQTTLNKYQSLILKNLRSHNKRNQKSSFIIISATIFIVFLRGFTTQLE